MSGTAVRTLKEASITESGLNPECAIGNDHSVGAHQAEPTAMKLVSAAFIVTVHQHDLGPDLVLFPALEMLTPSKPFGPAERSIIGVAVMPISGWRSLHFTSSDETGDSPDESSEVPQYHSLKCSAVIPKSIGSSPNCHGAEIRLGRNIRY
jgi:hypothetical protein